jgi:hypothetical protein
MLPAAIMLLAGRIWRHGFHALLAAGLPILFVRRLVPALVPPGA